MKNLNFLLKKLALNKQFLSILKVSGYIVASGVLSSLVASFGGNFESETILLINGLFNLMIKFGKDELFKIS